MPAKKKYLSSQRQRWLKVTAAILGSFFVTMTLQMAIGAHMEDKSLMLITSAYLSFFMWVGFMILPFYFDSGFKIWALYLAIIAVCSGIIYLGVS